MTQYDIVYSLFLFIATWWEDGFYEKSPDALSITATELNFKFPIDDVVYTVDDIIISSPGHMQAAGQTQLVSPTFTSFSRIG